MWLVKGGEALARDAVLAQWRSTLFLREAGQAARGWLIEVMKCAEALGRDSFELADIYAFEGRLSALYPGNHNVRPKIRQQLQVLRDRGWSSSWAGGGIGCGESSGSRQEAGGIWNGGRSKGGGGGRKRNGIRMALPAVRRPSRLTGFMRNRVESFIAAWPKSQSVGVSLRTAQACRVKSSPMRHCRMTLPLTPMRCARPG